MGLARELAPIGQLRSAASVESPARGPTTSPRETMKPRHLSIRVVLTSAVALLTSSPLYVAYAQQEPLLESDATPAPPPSAPEKKVLTGELATDAPITEFDFRSAVVSDTGLTADEAAQRARARAPQIASAQATATSAYWDSRQQLSGFVPQIRMYAQYKRINYVDNSFNLFPDPASITDPVLREFIEDLTPDDEPTFTQPVHNYLLGATASIPVSDMLLRVWPAYEASKNISSARKWQIESSVQEVELRAREAYYSYALSLANRAVFDQSVKQAEAQRDQIQLFVDAGTAAPVDLMTAVSRYEAARSALARSEGGVAVARNRLATLMGVPSAQVTTISEPISELPQGPSESGEDLVRRGIERRPELKALRELVNAGDLQKKAERGSALPQLSVDGSALYANPNPRYIPPLARFRPTWEVGATLAWTPQTSLIGYQRTQRADAEVARARADVMTLEDGVRMEVIQAYEDYKAADAAAQASRAQLEAADEAYRVRLAMYRVGAGVVIDLLQADLRSTEARLGLANAVIDARVALARLSRVAVLYE